MNIFFHIGARGSKGLKNKNILKINGIPLIDGRKQIVELRLLKI